MLLSCLIASCRTTAVQNFIDGYQIYNLSSKIKRMGPTPHSAIKSKNPYFQLFKTDRRHGRDVLVTQKMIPHFKIRQSWEKTVDQLRKSSDIYILIPNQWHVEQQAICGNGQLVEIEYPPFDINLTEFIEDKFSKGEHFEESQLWFVLFNLLQVGNRCNSLGRRIGDVRPSNILLNKAREMKVLTYLSFPNQINSFMQKQPKNYFSPEELEELNKGCMENLTNSIKSESFSIGLTLLSMALLHEMSHLYKSAEFNFEQLQRYLQGFQAITYYSKLEGKEVKYSTSICSAIGYLLKIHPESRIGYTSLYKQLQAFAQNIQGFQHFDTKIENSEAKSPNKEIIALRSRHKKQKHQGSPTVHQKRTMKQGNQGFSPIVESRYVGDDFKLQKSPISLIESDFLKKIDEKLKRSREEFPS